MPALLSVLQLETYAQHAAIIRLPLMGHPDERSALSRVGNVLSYAWAGIECTFL